MKTYDNNSDGDNIEINKHYGNADNSDNHDNIVAKVTRIIITKVKVLSAKTTVKLLVGPLDLSTICHKDN